MSGDLDEWRADGNTLAQIGRELFQVETLVTARLPLELARRAVAAWERDSVGDHSTDTETESERVLRHHAASLALIGLAIQERGTWHDHELEVPLDARLVGHALDCADDHGEIQGPPT